MALIFELLQSPYFLQGIAVSLLLVIVSNFYQELVDGFPYRNIPLVGMSRWGFTNSKAKERFVASAKALIAQGFSQVSACDHAQYARGADIGLGQDCLSSNVLARSHDRLAPAVHG
ncbi:hypothetical protein V8F44DRAFT_603973 [Aspergillus fumigatus]|jgi:hypothetical protein